MRCAKCCEDFDILPEHLLFPDRMSARGRAFVEVHGLQHLTLADLRTLVTVKDSNGRPLRDGLVRVTHRCDQLGPDNLCTIYETRPAICRAFICATRVGLDACTNEVEHG